MSLSKLPAPVRNKVPMIGHVSSPLQGVAGVSRSLNDAAIVGLMHQRRLLLVAARGFLVQYALQDVFALTCRKVVEKILWHHLDEAEQEVGAGNRNHPSSIFFFYLFQIHL